MSSVPRGLSEFLHRYIPEIEKEMFEFLPIQEPENFLYAPMRDYPERGGKRFRPALVLLACQVFNGDMSMISHDIEELASIVFVFLNFLRVETTGINDNKDPLETAQWTNYLPEAFGLREAVKGSSYRWCAREGYARICFV